MEEWRTESWQTMCPDADKEVAKIFAMLHGRELTPIVAFALLEAVPYKYPDSELSKETINPFFEHAIEAGYSDEELTAAYELVRYDGAYKKYLPTEKLKVWLYVWKACRNHDEANPSNSDYLLIDIESYFGIEEYEKRNDEDRWKDLSEDWASNVDSSGSSYGFSYGWETKEPSQDWINKKIQREKESIKRVESRIESFESYLK